MNEEFYYVLELDNQVLTEIDNVLKDISSAVVTSAAFDNGAEANVYLEHIMKTIPARDKLELDEHKNPDFFLDAQDIDFDEEWSDGEMIRINAISDECSVLTARLVVSGAPLTVPTISRTIQ